MVVQVDDLLVNSNENWYKKFVEYLQQKGFEVKDMGLASRFMGIEVKKLPKERMIILCQENYATEIVAGCRLPECRKKSNPLSIMTTLTEEQKEQCTKEEHAEYCCVIGAVMYLQIMTRLDLAP